MTTHDLKIWPEFFEPVLQGLKPFEFRSTIDRTFEVGDTLVLSEYDPRAPALSAFTGRVVSKTVSYVLRDVDAPNMVPAGFAFLGLARDPVDMLIFCPACGTQHVDKDEAAGMLALDVACYGEPWRNPPHRSHLCHNPECKHVWRPSDEATNGVASIKTKGKADHPMVRPVTQAGALQTVALQALKAIDEEWTEFWPLGPDVPESSERVAAIAPRTAEIWRLVRSALAATQPNAAPAAETIPDRLVQAFTRRGFRVPKTLDDAIASAANIMIEDGCIIDHRNRKLAAPAAEVVARIAELEAQLMPYLEAEAAQERFYARQQRVEKIADMLFPKFDSVAVRSGRKPGPLHWHEKSWWWNGVSVEWANSGGLDDNGGCVELSSYIGGGEVGTTEIDVPKAWLDADEDQWPILVDEYKKKKAQERAVAKAAQEAAEAQRQIEAAKATLRRLNGDAA